MTDGTKRIRIMVVPTDGAPYETTVTGLKDMQRLVGGYVEPCDWVFGDQPSVYINEEGKINGMKPNRAVYATEADEGAVRWDGTPIHAGDVLDILYGQFVCVGYDPESGDSRSLTDAEAKRVRDRFGADTVGSGLREALRIAYGASVR